MIVMPERLTVTPLSTVKTENGAALGSRWTVRFEAPGPSMEMLLSRAGRALVRSIVPVTEKVITYGLVVLEVGLGDRISQRGVSRGWIRSDHRPAC